MSLKGIKGLSHCIHLKIRYISSLEPICLHWSFLLVDTGWRVLSLLLVCTEKRADNWVNWRFRLNAWGPKFLRQFKLGEIIWFYLSAAVVVRSRPGIRREASADWIRWGSSAKNWHVTLAREGLWCCARDVMHRAESAHNFASRSKAAALFIRITPLNCKLRLVKGSINDTLLLRASQMKFIHAARSLSYPCHMHNILLCRRPIKRNERDTILFILLHLTHSRVYCTPLISQIVATAHLVPIP